MLALQVQKYLLKALDAEALLLALLVQKYVLKALDAEALLHKAASRFFHFDTPPHEHIHVLQYRFTVHSNGLCPLVLAATDTSCYCSLLLICAS
jgi:hypothetical protein